MEIANLVGSPSWTRTSTTGALEYSLVEVCAIDATLPVSDMFRMTAALCYRSLNNSKYRSRDIPAVRKLFLMTNTGAAAYLGITTGRITSDFVNTI